MFMKPNEFESILAARHPIAVSTRLRTAVGILLLAVLIPLMVGWFALIAIAVTVLAIFQIVRGAIRLLRQAAEHAGLLVIG